jgi:thioredoxin 1
MRRLGLLLIVLAVGCDRGQSLNPTEKAEASRGFSKETWKAEVLDSSEPVLVDFWAPWCAPCRMMEPTIKALSKDYKVRKVNVDNNRELAKEYGITAIPALLIFKDGRIISRHEGVTAESVLRNELQKVSQK